MAKIRMEILDSHCEAYNEIEELVDTADNGSLYHSPKFLSYHGPDKFNLSSFAWRSYLFRKGEKPVAFLPGMMVKQKDQTVSFKSPFGSSYGGLVYKDLNFDELGDCLEQWWADLMTKRVEKVEITPIPSFYTENGNTESFEFELCRRGFQLQDSELVLTARLMSGQKFPLNLFTRSGKKNFAKSMKSGVTVECSNDFRSAVDLFYPILVENRKRFNARPTHSYSEILKLKELFPERIHLFLGTLKNRILCGSLVFSVTRDVINTFYIADTPEARDYRATNGLVGYIYVWSLDRGIKWVDFGPSSFGIEPHSTLIRFKETLGGTGRIKRHYVWKRK